MSKGGSSSSNAGSDAAQDGGDTSGEMGNASEMNLDKPPSPSTRPGMPDRSTINASKKRARESGVSKDDNSRKRLKPSDNLALHLPEIVESGLPNSIETQILGTVKDQNTVVVVPSAFELSPLLPTFVAWSNVANESDQRRSGVTRLDRTTLLVVGDESSFDTFIRDFQHESLRVETYQRRDMARTDKSWDDLLEMDVVITTTEVLFETLSEGQLAMPHLNSMVFCIDESSENIETISSIMDRFYFVSDPLTQPRILAVVLASLSSFHHDSISSKIETIFKTEILDFSNEGKRVRMTAHSAQYSEMVVLYDSPFKIQETILYQQLHKLDPSETVFKRYFKAARYALREVGSCASDLVWRRALKDIEASARPWYEEDEDMDKSSLLPSQIRTRTRDIVKDWSFSMPIQDPSSKGFNLTPKFLRMIHVLQTFESYGDSFRGIIFVQRRAVALAIADILRALNDHLPFLRPQAFVATSQMLNHRHDELQAFASGAHNLLIATKGAEDLDLPKATVIIRFDFFESQISYAHVLSLLKGRESHLIHMVERSNDSHRRILSQITEMGPSLRKWTETLRAFPESSYPPSRLLETVDPYRSDSEDEGEVNFIKDPTTGGRLYPQDATTAIFRLASQLRDKGTQIEDQPLFEFEELSSGSKPSHSVICTVRFPETAYKKFSGKPSPSAALARRSACYEACLQLSELGLLDYSLFPQPTVGLERTHASGPTKTAHRISNNSGSDANEEKGSGTRCYPLKVPDFWGNSGAASTNSLFPMVVTKDAFSDMWEAHVPIVLLTRQPLPALREFNIFRDGVSTCIQLQRALPIEVSESQLSALHGFTLRLCRSVAYRSFTCPLQNMKYFLAPLEFGWRPAPVDSTRVWSLPDISSSILWDQVNGRAGLYSVPLKFGKPATLQSDIVDAMVQDRSVEFTRRYTVAAIRDDLTPNSKPADSPRESKFESLVDFIKTRHPAFDGLKDEEQAILQVDVIPPVVNFLNPTAKCQVSNSQMRHIPKYMIPELGFKHTIPYSTFSTAYLLPSITRRIDEFLLVKELNSRFFDNCVSEDLLHMAICSPSCGAEYDYERLELLGDAFLKYLSSVYVFVTCPAQKEGALHVSRQRIISNRSLLHNSTRVGLPPYIQAKPFIPKLWLPPCFEVEPRPPRGGDEGKEQPGNKDASDEGEKRGSQDGDEAKLSEGETRVEPAPEVSQEMEGEDTLETGEIKEEPDANEPLKEEEIAITTQPTQRRGPSKKRIKNKRMEDDQNNLWLGDKAIADVAEAIIGAGYITGGREVALKVTKALRIPIPNADRWSDFGRKVLAPPPRLTAKMKPGTIEAVEEIIGCPFKHPHLLAQALTHASIQGYESTSYERLEFIGDAILDFMVIRHIFDREKELDPGGLTLLKAAMVSNSALGALCVWSGLQEHLLFESYYLDQVIKEYAAQITVKEEEEYAAAAKEGRNPGQYWDDTEPPKALSDVIESIIGAMYLSDNFSPSGAEAIFDRMLKPFYDKHITLSTISLHPTKVLFEMFQKFGCQKFELVKESLEDGQLAYCEIVIHDVVLASAEDPMAQLAARRVSLFALDAIEGEKDFLEKTCDCRKKLVEERKKRKMEQKNRQNSKQVTNESITDNAEGEKGSTDETQEQPMVV